jgi:hypothetical protein
VISSISSLRRYTHAGEGGKKNEAFNLATMEPGNATIVESSNSSSSGLPLPQSLPGDLILF